jgi:hypothetical protein
MIDPKWMIRKADTDHVRTKDGQPHPRMLGLDIDIGTAAMNGRYISGNFNVILSRQGAG